MSADCRCVFGVLQEQESCARATVQGAPVYPLSDKLRRWKAVVHAAQECEHHCVCWAPTGHSANKHAAPAAGAHLSKVGLGLVDTMYRLRKANMLTCGYQEL
jgi:uncharacterized protein YchJ